MRALNRVLRVATAVAMVGAVLTLGQTPASAGGNLLPNSGFEESAVEPAPVPQYTNPQPLLPTGWAFEGAAGLFDHSQNVKKNGRRSAAISIPASGSRKVCQDPVGCNDVPANAGKDAALIAVSAAPAWRNAVPVAVNGGQAYTLSAWTSGELATTGEGVFTAVRWLDAAGVPISVSNGPTRRAMQFKDLSQWAQISGSVTAPANARQAVVLFGHTDDAWISQVRFDDVFFG